ncbi:MAG: hypothetical protein MZV70_55640 [Desulfobacterales bacterium]|nr:hypothetical protein [Desulfobacterales bacterium]
MTRCGGAVLPRARPQGREPGPHRTAGRRHGRRPLRPARALHHGLFLHLAPRGGRGRRAAPTARPGRPSGAWPRRPARPSSPGSPRPRETGSSTPASSRCPAARAPVVYRKTHLFYREKDCFDPGDTGFFTVRDPARDVTIGPMICYDWRFPEAARALTLAGAELIVCPANLVTEAWRPVMPARAIENKVFLALANRTGLESRDGEELLFKGGSAVWRLGRAAARPGRALRGDGAGGARSTRPRPATSPSTPRNDVLRDRRPEHYGRLIGAAATPVIADRCWTLARRAGIQPIRCATGAAAESAPRSLSILAQFSISTEHHALKRPSVALSRTCATDEERPLRRRPPTRPAGGPHAEARAHALGTAQPLRPEPVHASRTPRS